MVIDRVANWQRFSKHMEAYIREHTVEKYTAEGNEGFDLMSMTNSPIICVWNVIKYSLRIYNSHMKPHDLEKIVHYAEIAWTMADGKIIKNEGAEKQSVCRVLPGRSSL